jgi:hypothetical protein
MFEPFVVVVPKLLNEFASQPTEKSTCEGVMLQLGREQCRLMDGVR